LELGSLIGFLAAWIFIILSLIIGAQYDMDKVIVFINAPGVMIVIGGSVSATIFAYPLSRLVGSFKTAGRVFREQKLDPFESIKSIIVLANIARKEGLLALEESASSMEDQFLQKGVMLIVDGTDPELVRNILETDMAYIDERHTDARSMWEFLGTMAPSFGMMGTLIALIIMLQDLSDAATLGPAMAVALITTFYGAIIANMICAPISNKLKIFSAEEMVIKGIQVEGMLSIQAGENPRIIEEKLKSFLSPKLRRGFAEASVSD
jgi:chemotaxis protein MotA